MGPTDEEKRRLKGSGIEPLAYTVAGACDAISIRPTALYGLIAAGKIEARKIGARTVIPAASLRVFLEGLPPATITTGQNKTAA